MLSKLLSLLSRVFTAPSDQENLDAFIAKQMPTSVGDVEYWINVYERNQRRSRDFYIG